MTAVIQKQISQLKITWPLLPDDFILPDDPVENIEHPLIANGLRQSLVDSLELTQDALIVSNFALCAAVDDRTICKAPDWMYVRPVQPWPHQKTRGKPLALDMGRNAAAVSTAFFLSLSPNIVFFFFTWFINSMVIAILLDLPRQ